MVRRSGWDGVLGGWWGEYSTPTLDSVGAPNDPDQLGRLVAIPRQFIERYPNRDFLPTILIGRKAVSPQPFTILPLFAIRLLTADNSFL